MAVKEKQSESSDEIEWNVETEIHLFYAMNGHKPVGLNKYFHMVCIWEKFRAAINKDISLKAIWNHLETMYDLVALDEMENLPFPSTEADFALPESDFGELMKSKQKDDGDQSKQKDQKDKVKEIKKEKDTKETPKKEIVSKDLKTPKELEKKKEDPKKTVKEVEIKKEKPREVKETKKDLKTPKGRGKGKEEVDEAATAVPVKKERKDPEVSRETPKRVPKRPTRQSIDNASKASTSPRDTPPPKRRRI